MKVFIFAFAMWICAYPAHAIKVSCHDIKWYAVVGTTHWATVREVTFEIPNTDGEMVEVRRGIFSRKFDTATKSTIDEPTEFLGSEPMEYALDSSQSKIHLRKRTHPQIRGYCHLFLSEDKLHLESEPSPFGVEQMPCHVVQ